MVAATSLLPLWNRAAEWARRLAMIREAQSFLYLSTFYLEYDAYGRELLAELLSAQQRGVQVNLLVDAFGQRLGGVLMSRPQLAELEQALAALRSAGGVVTLYRPPRWVQRQLGGGQHVKIQVSEAGEAIFGSSNVTRSSFEGWNEYSVAVRGPVAHALLQSYVGLGGTVEPRHLEHLQSLQRMRQAEVAAPAESPLELDYWFFNPNPHQGRFGPLGWRRRNLVTDRLLEMIEAARTSISLTSFYFKPVAPLLQALLRAARRGVQVRVFHSHREALPSTDLAWIAAAVSYRALLEAGVELYENLHGEHSKLVLVDGAWVAFGSYNFEDAAHDRLAEAMLASRDRRAISPVEAIFDELRQHPDNVRVTRATLEQLPRRTRARLALYGRFKRWM